MWTTPTGSIYRWNRTTITVEMAIPTQSGVARSRCLKIARAGFRAGKRGRTRSRLGLARFSTVLASTTLRSFLRNEDAARRLCRYVHHLDSLRIMSCGAYAV